jgi:hypothetical protein
MVKMTVDGGFFCKIKKPMEGDQENIIQPPIVGCGRGIRIFHYGCLTAVIVFFGYLIYSAIL